MDHGEFRGSRYLRELDGLRALAILQVVSTHTTDPIWRPLIGPVGVTISFVISGFIITTLLLREEDKRGSIRITDFYLRRAFRLLPLYYLILAVYILLVAVLRVQPGAPAAWHTLPYYLGYQNDLVSGDWGYNMTWSLAMEEKFYILWPLVFFVPALLRRRRFPATVVLAAALMPFALLPGRGTYPAYFAPIVIGCLVAQLMHRPATYARLRPLTGTAVATLILVLAVVEGATVERQNSPHVLFALLIALALPACLTGPGRLRAALGSRLLVHVGTRAYALYLVHRLGKGTVDRVLPPGGAVWEQALRYLLIVAVALAAAEVLRHTFEQPMIRLGRRIIARRAQRRETATARDPRLGTPGDTARGSLAALPVGSAEGGRDRSLAGLHLHDLWHTGSIVAAETGASLRDLVARLGQASARAALMHPHRSSDGDRAIANSPEELLRRPQADGGEASGT